MQLVKVDSLLLINEFHGDSLIIVYNLNTNQIDRHLISKGEGPNELIPPLDLCVTDNNLYILSRPIFSLNHIPLDALSKKVDTLHHVDENRARIEQLFAAVSKQVVEYTSYVGQQQFLLNRDKEMSVSEGELYFKTAKPKQIASLQQSIEKWIKANYPDAVITFSPPETVFEKLFVTGEADIVAELYTHNKTQAPDVTTLRKLEEDVRTRTGHARKRYGEQVRRL